VYCRCHSIKWMEGDTHIKKESHMSCGHSASAIFGYIRLVENGRYIIFSLSSSHCNTEHFRATLTELAEVSVLSPLAAIIICLSQKFLSAYSYVNDSVEISSMFFCTSRRSRCLFFLQKNIKYEYLWISNVIWLKAS